MIKPLRLIVFWLFTLLLLERCAYKDLNDLEPEVDCSLSGLKLTATSVQDASSCRSIDGRISVIAEGGSAPYDFSINGGTYQTGGEFINLAPGVYSVWVKDINSCSRIIEVAVNAANSTLSASYSATPDSQCFSHDGTVTVSASGGKSPYVFAIDASAFVASNVFSNLKSGQHSAIVKDADDCQRVISIQVPRSSTGTSYANTIKPILQANCTSSGCHGTNSSNGDWTNYTKVKEKAGLIKMRTSNKSMPIGGNSLTDTEIQLIACWVDDGAPNN
jgi:hypothetical protein